MPNSNFHMRNFISKRVTSIRRSLSRWFLLKSQHLDPEMALWSERFPFPLGMQGEPFKFFEDGLATIHACEFLKNEKFVKAYDLGAQTGSWGGWAMRWRVRIILWCATWASKLPGAFVECGVNKGGFTKAILGFIDLAALRKNYFLFDTFCGFDTQNLSDAEITKVANHYRYDDCYTQVSASFADMPFVKIVRGSVPSTLDSIQVGDVALLSIDMNCVEPEIAAIKFFWPHIVPGGVVVLDDYGFTLHREQKKAFDEWACKQKVDIMELPTGQALIFKGFTNG